MTAVLDLERYLPYRLSVLSNRISHDIASLYNKRFGLSVTEWRVIAVLAKTPGLSAREVCARTAMDKVAISRAVAALTKDQRIERATDNDDKRRSILRLTHAGREIYDIIAPQALDYEKRMLEALSAEERTALDHLLKRIEQIKREMK